MRVLLALAVLPLLTTYAPFGLYVPPVVPTRSTIAFQPVALDGEATARARLGRLIYLGGWALKSNDPRLGGISAIHVEDDMMVAVSDTGMLVRFTLPGHPTPFVSIGALPEGPGSQDVKFDRDAEAMVIHGRYAWIGFEGSGAVWRYLRHEWRSDAATVPPPMRRWPANSGAEAMVRLPDGHFLVFSEGRRGTGGSTEVLLFEGDPAVAGTGAVRLGYRAPEGYRITDAALLPDGRLLFLNRRFGLIEGFSAKLTMGDASELAAGTVLQGKEIARFDEPVIADNMEALSVTQENGRTIIWIASDDNFSALQQTLLLKFALQE